MFTEHRKEKEQEIELRKQIIHEMKESANCKMKIVYFAGRFNGFQDNIKRLEPYIIKYMRNHEDIIPLSPLHAMGFLYGQISEQRANKDCLSWLAMSCRMVVCGEYPETSFVNAEIKFAEENGIPIEYID